MSTIYELNSSEQSSGESALSHDIPPNNVSPPEIVGETKIGSTVSTKPGVWAGNPAPDIKTALLVDGTSRQSPYQIRPEDDGKQIVVVDTASNRSGKATLFSNCLRIGYLAPQALGVPVDVTIPLDESVTIDTDGFFANAMGGAWTVTVPDGEGQIAGEVDESGQLIIKAAGSLSVGYENSGGTAAITFATRQQLPAKPNYDGSLGNLSVQIGESVTITAGTAFTGEDLVFEARGLPLGLEIDAVGGEVRGTATIAGTFEVTVLAMNEAGSAEGAFSIAVSEPEVQLRIDPLENRSYEVGSGTRYYNIVAEGNVIATGPVTCFMLPKVIQLEAIDLGDGDYGCRAMVAGMPKPSCTTQWLLDGKPVSSGETSISTAGLKGELTVEFTAKTEDGEDRKKIAVASLTPVVEPVHAATAISTSGSSGRTTFEAENPAYSAGDLVLVAIGVDRGLEAIVDMKAAPNGEAVTRAVAPFDTGDPGSGGTQIGLYWYVAEADRAPGAALSITCQRNEQFVVSATVIKAGTFNTEAPVVNATTSSYDRYDSSKVVSPATKASKAGGMVFFFGGCDEESFTGTPPGWTKIADANNKGIIGGYVARRNALTDANETIASEIFELTGSDKWIGITCIVNPG